VDTFLIDQLKVTRVTIFISMISLRLVLLADNMENFPQKRKKKVVHPLIWHHHEKKKKRNG
jgi:hypothetical protein